MKFIRMFGVNKKTLFFICLCLFFSGCWTDHFGVTERFDDEELLEYKKCESLKSQYNFLLEHEFFSSEDMKKKVFSKLSREERLKVFLALNPNLHPEDKTIISAGKYYQGVSQAWILAVFGPPTKSDEMAGLEFWYYADREFRFQNSEMLEEIRY